MLSLALAAPESERQRKRARAQDSERATESERARARATQFRRRKTYLRKSHSCSLTKDNVIRPLLTSRLPSQVFLCCMYMCNGFVCISLGLFLPVSPDPFFVPVALAIKLSVDPLLVLLT